jgi:hypothetical protein
MEFRPCMFHNQSLLNDSNRLATDHLNKVSLLGKSTSPQLKSLGPIVLGYGLVIVITCDLNSGSLSACFRC